MVIYNRCQPLSSVSLPTLNNNIGIGFLGGDAEGLFRRLCESYLTSLSNQLRTTTIDLPNRLCFDTLTFNEGTSH
jgi:hypothetical protein